MKIFCLNVQVSGVYEDLFMLMCGCVWVCVCVCVCAVGIGSCSAEIMEFYVCTV